MSEGFDYDESDLASEDSLWALYERWWSHFNISKVTSVDEKHKRFPEFKKTALKVHEFNKTKQSCTLRLNRFAHMTNEEFMRTHCGTRMRTELGDAMEGEARRENGRVYAYVYRIRGCDGR